jgi:gamma-glutamylcyclotransferase
MKYFAYGSNMLEQWIRSPDRVPTAQFAGLGFVRGRRLRFHKKSQDGSGKCDIPESGNETDIVYGVLYEIPDTDICRLDRAEGAEHGYNRSELMVSVEGQTCVLATVYLADASHIDALLQPYEWYRELVFAGAEQHNLPEEYKQAISSVPARPDQEGSTRKTAVAAAKALGSYLEQEPKAPNDVPQESTPLCHSSCSRHDS